MGENEGTIRVLQITTQMVRGGLETFLMNLYRNIDRDRVQFDFLVHRQAPGDYDEEIRSLGGKIFIVPRQNPFDPGYFKAVRKFFSEHREYRIAHAHLDCMSALPLSCARKEGVPVRIAHSHNAAQTKDLKLPLKLMCMRKIPREATELLSCGKAAGDFMFGGAPYQVIPNAIDTEQFLFQKELREKARKELGFSEEELVVGHIGRFMEQKNHPFLLRIFSALLRKRKNSRLLLVGEGPLMEEMKAQAKELGISENCVFTGVREDTPALYQAMDVFCLPSLYEGFPVVMIEAQTAGLPCLISDTVSPECILTDHVEQLPLHAGEEAWAEKLLSIAGGDRSDGAGKVQSAGYDVRENAKRMQKHYEDLYHSTDL